MLCSLFKSKIPPKSGTILANMPTTLHAALEILARELDFGVVVFTARDGDGITESLL
jgi:hypothetical protein